MKDVTTSLKDTTNAVIHNDKRRKTTGPSVLQVENKARKTFHMAIEATRPGFGGEKDKFSVEVTQTRPLATERDSGVEHVAVGTVLHRKSWKRKRYEPQSITKIGEATADEYASSGYTGSKITEVTSYFRGDLAKMIKENRGREMPGFMSFTVFKESMGSYVDLWIGPTAELQNTVEAAFIEAAFSFTEDITATSPHLSCLINCEIQK